MGTEPITINTAIKEALSSLLKAIVIFGLWQMTTEQFGVLMIAVDSTLAVIFLLWQARGKSTSIAAPRIPAGTLITSYNPETGADVAQSVAPQSTAAVEPAPDPDRPVD